MLKKKLYIKIKIPTLIILSLLVTLLCCYWLLIRQGRPFERNAVHKLHYQLIVLIFSGPDNLKQRYAIRKTWLSEKSTQVRHLFAIGSLNLDPEQLVTLKSEEAKYNDLLLLPKLHDSYNILTKKLLQSFAFIYENYQFDYLLKCDDDSFVLLNEVLQNINEWHNSRTDGTELYWGFFNGKANIKKNGPWKEPNWIFCDYYLPYALGGGYILSSNLIQFIVKNKNVLKLFNSEDVSVGLWLAPVANIERKHDVRFDTEYRSRGCSNQYIITHKQTVDNMKNLHDHYQTTGLLCTTEFQNRMSYQYNWTVPPSQCCNRQIGIP